MRRISLQKPLVDRLLVLMLLLLGVLSRGYGLGDWSVVHDEFYTIHFASERYATLVNPAYYALVLASFDLLGPTELAARLPAMLLGVLGLPVFYLLYRDMLGRGAALIGALLILFCSWHLWHSQFSRFYTGVFLFGAVAYALYWRAFAEDSLRHLAWAVAATAVATLFHLTAVMVGASVGLFAILTLAGWAGPTPSRRVARWFLGLGAAGALVTTPLLLAVMDERVGQAIGPTWGDGPAEMLLQIAHHIGLPIAAAAVAGLVLLARRDRPLALFFASGIALPALFVIVAAAFLNSRAVYLFYALPLVIALAGYFCTAVAPAGRRAYLERAAVVAVLVVALLPEFVSHYAGRQSLDVRDVVRFLEAQQRPGDVVVALTSDYEHYADKERATLLNRYDKGKERAPEAWLSELRARHPRVWVVTKSHRQSKSPPHEKWMARTGHIAWQAFETRFDYIVTGYTVYLLEGTGAP